MFIESLINIFQPLLLLIILLGVSLFFVIAAVRRCVMCILPRFNFTVKKSPLFFGDISKYKDFETFFESLEEVLNDETNYRKHLTQSVYATANIASIKFFNVNKGLRHLLKSIIFLISKIYNFWIYIILLLLFTMINNNSISFFISNKQ